MKIHIVQKGDTLWEISKAYGVDFEELKTLNTQLSSPDMIMPGMKIKVPGSTKPVKQEKVSIKEVEKQAAKKESNKIVKEGPQTTTKEAEFVKPLPIIKEDDHIESKKVKENIPINFSPKDLPKLGDTTKVESPKKTVKETSKQSNKNKAELPDTEGKTVIKSPKVPQGSQPLVQQSPINQQNTQQYFGPPHQCYQMMGKPFPGQYMYLGCHPMFQQAIPIPVNYKHCQPCSCHQFISMCSKGPMQQAPQPFPLPNYDELTQQRGYRHVQVNPNSQASYSYSSYSNPYVSASPVPPGYLGGNRERNGAMNRVNGEQKPNEGLMDD